MILALCVTSSWSAGITQSGGKDSNGAWRENSNTKEGKSWRKELKNLTNSWDNDGEEYFDVWIVENRCFLSVTQWS